MKEFALLTNSTYLYLLQHKGIKVNYSAIASEVGLTRQTVAREYKEFCNLENWDKLFLIKDFHNDEPNKNLRALKILHDLRPDIIGIESIAKALGISAKTLYTLNIKNSESTPISCIYKISYQDEIIYIGSTSNFEGRKYQHLTAIENKKTDKKLYKYCADNNISYRDVKIEPIITEAELSRFNVENLIINLLKPIGNCESIKN